MPSSASLLSSFSRLSVSHTQQTPVLPFRLQFRYASHASQGVANGAAQGPGKRLGAKKGNTELVVPGNIIFRQRGTHWFAGENCSMGRDHTISSLVKGYVRYYRDPSWPEKKFIGVVLDQNEQLPRRHGVPRRRRLGMEPRQMDKSAVVAVQAVTPELVKEAVNIGVGRRLKVNAEPDTRIRQGYQVRESNWSIGRTVERENIGVRDYKPNDRWQAWRTRRANYKRAAETRVSRARQVRPTRGPKGKAQKKRN